MYRKLTRPPTTNTPAPDCYKRKCLICNHPDRDSIAFLIDTAAIRNGHNPFRINETTISNRYKIGLFYVPHDGAIRPPARVPGELLSPVSTRNTLGNRNRLKFAAINDINFSTRNKTGGGANHYNTSRRAPPEPEVWKLLQWIPGSPH